MKNFLLIFLFLTISVFSDGLKYIMRVDGLACPYCAYGIEKKLKALDGVEKINVDLEKGVVIVHVKKGTTFTKEQMIKLFNDAGFTFRGMKKESL